MPAQRIGWQRLLEALQCEPIEPREVRRVLERVRTVGVGRERDVVAQFGPDRGNRRDVGVRLDLHLDAPVARRRVRGREGAQFLLVIGDADRDAAGHARARPAEVGRKRDLGRP